jgi:AraC-like DNA-binding protein
MQNDQIADAPDVGAMADDAVHTPFVEASQIEAAQFVPPAALAPYVTQFYHFRCNLAVMRDAQPASLGHLVFYLQGAGTLRFADGNVNQLPITSIFGPGMTHGEFDIAGPFENFGLALSPLGFVALTGKSAAAYADRLVDAAEIFGPEINQMGRAFREQRNAGQLTVQNMVAQVTDYLVPQIRKVPERHIALINTTSQWLSSEFDPDVELLFDQLPSSRSTVTRLIRRYFGASPKQLMRKYRALRAATLLVDPEATPEMRARVESLFYDQPHMIREIRHFTGRTPGVLDSDDTKILRVWLSKDNFRQLEAYPG